MPFSVEKLCGTWKVGSQSDNFTQIMEKLGVPAEMIQKLREVKVPMNASLAGDKLKYKMEFMGKQQETTFNLGVEGEEDDPLVGGKRRVIYTIEGDHLVAVYPDYNGSGTSVRISHHLVDDDTIHTDMKAGDLEGWQVIKRC
ncbi:Hypp1157 [Branchiostoma lanceolatum]|uniref:Hypp1157 protein n=1 Tax=Branchiostoma lanceolatum TaxID=7740 RepID=A0A8K0EM79_BRALA|nr:Hypp1157 [Branchiostoma lanceolatum]